MLDWMMPGVSGLEVLRRVRSDPDLAGVPIIMLTGIDADRLPEAVDAGADWIVTKPFLEEDLREAVYSLFPREPARASRTRMQATRRQGPESWNDLS